MASTIGSRRQSTAPASSSHTGGAVQLPPHETPVAPLSTDGLRKLNNLLSEYPLSGLIDKLKTGADLLSASAADINERVYDKTQRNRLRQENQRAKRAKIQPTAPDAEAEEVGSKDEEEMQDQTELDELKGKVDTMTPQMDAGVRKMIDNLAGVDFLKKSVEKVQSEARTLRQQAPLSTQLTSTTRASEPQDGNADGEEPQITQPSSTLASVSASTSGLAEIFQDHYQSQKDRYGTMAARQRYGASDIYTGFKRGVWESRHAPDQAPPMPKASSWFISEEKEDVAPAPGVTSRGAAAAVSNEEEDDDIEVALVQTSTTCPLTLKEFEEPVTSTKCPHSFERRAIESLLAEVRPPNSSSQRGGRSTHRPPPPPPNWQPSVRCPVGGCENMLTRSHLTHDAALVRRIKRIQRARQHVDAEEERAGNRMDVDEIEDEEADADADNIDDIIDDEHDEDNQRSRGGLRGSASLAAARVKRERLSAAISSSAAAAAASSFRTRTRLDARQQQHRHDDGVDDDDVSE